MSHSQLLLNDVGRWSLRVDHRVHAPAGPLLRTIGVKSRPTLDMDFADINGDAAVRALTSMLPLANQAGGNKKTVDSAVSLMMRRSSGMGLLIPTIRQRTSSRAPTRIGLGEIDYTIRLALEMTLHEDDERRALEGEMAALEARWREAEEIAGISDSLLLPADIDAELERLRSTRRA